ncbi:flavodoxin [Clostridium algoriphilum]|uniref:flavodoxin n=1 Tax=Clostridium algoriphilum TaxID=198347 RepID=UPI001CF590C3|nr:flavodoxin [Clostridium algoriphilum]MCB2292357.1 flavodoxin [Clostridium algoriphilum]
MKKLFALTLVMIMAFTLTACGNNNRSTKNSDESSTQKKIETTTSDESNNQTKDTAKKDILVAYFSHSGNTKVIANQIHESVGGNIFEIKTVVPYSTDNDTVVDKAEQEQKDNYRPKLATKVENMNSYDVIYLGYPDWWGTMPMAVFTFLEGYNFSGKTIIPFCTHEGSGLGQSVTDIKKLCPQSTILEGLAIWDTNLKNGKEDVSEWLHKIGIIKE